MNLTDHQQSALRWLLKRTEEERAYSGRPDKRVVADPRSRHVGFSTMAALQKQGLVASEGRAVTRRRPHGHRTHHYYDAICWLTPEGERVAREGAARRNPVLTRTEDRLLRIARERGGLTVAVAYGARTRGNRNMRAAAHLAELGLLRRVGSDSDSRRGTRVVAIHYVPAGG